MKMNITEWNHRAWIALEKIPTVIIEPVRSQWSTFAQKNKPVVTFFGPFATGKSSLLKRLLLDDGIIVPDWLTISGRRETFEDNEIEVCDVIIQDTPGISGGNLVHAAVTDSALLKTDAVVVMLPPQLITGDESAVVAITSVLDGTHYHCGPDSAFSEGALLIVLARMDGAGVMPDIDLNGYESLVTRKHKELGGLLSKFNIPEKRISIHAVSADWAGMAGPAEEATAADYDKSRNWDGIASLAADLRSLAARREELRLWSERRFLCYQLGKIQRSLEINTEETRLASESAANEVESLSLQQSRLNSLIGNAKANLSHRVKEEVLSISQRGDADPETVRQLLSERLTGSLQRWWDAQDAALGSLTAEFDAEMQQRHARPDWRAMADILEGNEPRNGQEGNDSESGSGTFQRKEVLHISQMLRKAYQEATPLILDMSIIQAREELNRLKQSDSFQEYSKQAAKRKGMFRDPSHANQAKTMLKVDVALTVAVPLIVEIAGIVSDYQEERRTAENSIARRKNLNAQLDAAAQSVIGEAWRQWHDGGLAAALSSALDEASEGASTRTILIRQQLDTAKDSLSQIREALNA